MLVLHSHAHLSGLSTPPSDLRSIPSYHDSTTHSRTRSRARPPMLHIQCLSRATDQTRGSTFVLVTYLTTPMENRSLSLSLYTGPSSLLLHSDTSGSSLHTTGPLIRVHRLLCVQCAVRDMIARPFEHSYLLYILLVEERPSLLLANTLVHIGSAASILRGAFPMQSCLIHTPASMHIRLR